MLVLVSFGLVLLATILLVVGLLSDDGINLIYLSIAASATAAVVLFLAFRMARPKSGSAAGEEPTPLADDLETADATEVVPVAAAPAVAAAAPPAAPAPATPAPSPEPVAAPAEDDWADDADWEVGDDVEFPIADYDDLTVSEIMPLLPQLYSDELDLVYEREAGGKNRVTILSELDKLKVTGTEADALEQAEAAQDFGAADGSSADDTAVVPTADEVDVEEIEAIEEEIATPPPAQPAAPVSLLGDDDDEDDAAFFPIADYDDLSVSQIMPLLSQLELDELEDVKAREVAGANRKTLVTEIDRYLNGELEAFSWDDQESAVEPEPEAEEPVPVVDPEAARLPIADYPSLNVPDVVAQLDDLTPAQLEQVLAYESERDNRVGVVSEINDRLEAAPAPTIRRGGRTATKKAPAKRSAPRKQAAKKATSKRASSKKATKARKTAKKATRFPIANYDDLTVADIRPRLTDLSDNQLRQVREREAAGAGRKTILKDIDNRLS